CCLKHQEDGAREGAIFIREHIIRVCERAFDDFAAAGVNRSAIASLLGLSGDPAP
ncbi:MAG: sugar phosphate isomerase/epimerase, partial [Rhodoferax sp.]|nr:sugar phosphate isomerase/epimerase [Rhodoferax sp.]